jgi:uncharacterized membrane protein
MSALDKAFATLSLLAFAGFLGILIYFVPRPGLVVVSVASVLLCGYDFVRSAYIRRWRERAHQRGAGA